MIMKSILYICKLGEDQPDGAVDIADGVNLDSTATNKLVGIEILNASHRFDIKTILSYSLELNQNPVELKAA